MSSLQRYIEKVKKETEQMSETETIRYVYLDLGERFSFDLNYSFGNSATKKEIYRHSASRENLEKCMETNIGICKSIAYILEYVLKALGIHIKTIIVPDDYSDCLHVYNVVTEKDGREYIIDLQEDLENIQFHFLTKKFGLPINPNEPPVFERKELEEMDKKLGYITEGYYYADDYSYFMQSVIGQFSTLKEKAEVFFSNIEPYDSSDVQYAERKCHHKQLVRALFSEHEQRKIKLVDCYQENSEQKNYLTCVVIDQGKIPDIYLYSTQKCRYEKISMEELVGLIKHGLVPLVRIPKLKNYLQKQKEEREI